MDLNKMQDLMERIVINQEAALKLQMTGTPAQIQRDMPKLVAEMQAQEGEFEGVLKAMGLPT